MTRTIPKRVIHEVDAFCELREGERLIFERINGQVMARIETADVPVLGTTPIEPASSLPGDIDPLGSLAHLSPADRESARRLNEALAEPDVNKADLRWRFEVTNPDGTPVSEEERQEFVRKAMEFAARMDKVLFAFNS